MLLVRGGRIMNARGSVAGDVLIDGERIVAVGPDLDATGCDVFDAGGALMITGAIDPHMHVDLPVGAGRSPGGPR